MFVNQDRYLGTSQLRSRFPIAKVFAKQNYQIGLAALRTCRAAVPPHPSIFALLAHVLPIVLDDRRLFCTVAFGMKNGSALTPDCGLCRTRSDIKPKSAKGSPCILSLSLRTRSRDPCSKCFWISSHTSGALDFPNRLIFIGEAPHCKDRQLITTLPGGKGDGESLSRFICLYHFPFFLVAWILSRAG